MARPTFKMCGLMQEDDVLQAVSHNADLLGFVFADSRRQVKKEDVRLWLQKAPSVSACGLFVNPTLEEVEQVLKTVPLQIVQLHGTESPAFAAEVKALGVEVYKALHHRSETDARDVLAPFFGIADGFIIDTYSKNGWGGTGEQFDWEAVPCYRDEAKRFGVPLLIAGGITPENVDQLLTYHPPGIDVSSGIEENRMKSASRMKALEERLRAYERELSR
ncbi:phosphoribosylanthranilate isomerase [Salsuginibacillus halophilus]|uniref:N-(5'-phosphoribosyl)anthranilate isomerase n=1 Tax=Salsuginibacillus halophilus TaxID=517424 RepID=A0A2P8HW93_9BACI|nr:phosphoribosylanthranilate isomerase [Salsuginibacillus halophilus]PSL50501.1 phosphoribosylanthranilate isomerase [Salsuginibacillus halophilus]